MEPSQDVLKSASTILATSSDTTSNLFWMNSSEIGYASETNGDGNKNQGIWIYNVISNEWKLYIEYPSDMPDTKCH